ncbi:hypothetical protein J8C06_02200 [Chloracidobacterium validum]|uniref:Uncharacterized protein n=1 Tax=Chloracidobacterium validum TaxID=2821543 RepID=A0ABX8B9C9_9BACT|nr:hypothetical protein [Chloracidobacterium validum]QUW03271.1 hypothetical protein J8C06_02200 [Chloracidobacterium validum]
MLHRSDWQHSDWRAIVFISSLTLFMSLGTTQAAAQYIPARATDLAPRPAETVQDGGGTLTTPSPPDATPSEKKDRTSVNFASGRGTVSEDDYHPLSGKERWQYYLRTTYWSPAAVFGAAGPAIGAQAGNSPPEWGGGIKGYSRRLASEFGNNIITNSIQSGLAALIKHEPRYVRSAKKGFFKRTGHALAFVFVTYNDDGKVRPAIANLAADYGGAFAQIAWYPSRYTIRGDGVRFGNLALGFNFVANLINEFTPDIKRVFKRK